MDKARARQLAHDGLNTVQIGRVMGRSHRTISDWVRRVSYAEIPQPDPCVPKRAVRCRCGTQLWFSTGNGVLYEECWKCHRRRRVIQFHAKRS